MPALTPSAAANSAATAASGSIHHNSRSPAGSLVRRVKISAITANLREPAAFSARTHPPAASTNSASVSDAKSETSGNDPSNMHSKLPPPGDVSEQISPVPPTPVDELATVDNACCGRATRAGLIGAVELVALSEVAV